MGSSTIVSYVLAGVASICFFSGLAIISHEGVKQDGETRNHHVDAR